MANPETSNTGLKPAPMEQGGLRKLRRGVIAFCFAELWALVSGSGVLWYAGLVHNAGFLMALTCFGAVGMGPIGGQIETWLAIMTGEPILNDKGEDDSTAPFERGMWYLLPPFVACFGVFGIPAHCWWVPVITSAVSLLLFARHMRRILKIWRNYQPESDF